MIFSFFVILVVALILVSCIRLPQVNVVQKARPVLIQQLELAYHFVDRVARHDLKIDIYCIKRQTRSHCQNSLTS